MISVLQSCYLGGLVLVCQAAPERSFTLGTPQLAAASASFSMSMTLLPQSETVSVTAEGKMP